MVLEAIGSDRAGIYRVSTRPDERKNGLDTYAQVPTLVHVPS